MDKYKLQAIENVCVVILSLGIIVCSALFNWWLLLLLLLVSPDKYVKEVDKNED